MMTGAQGEPLDPRQEQTVQEFAAELGLGDVDVPEGVRISQAYGAGYGTGYADGERRGRGIAAHPAGRRPVGPRGDVRILVLEGLAVGAAWILGSLLGDAAAREVLR